MFRDSSTTAYWAICTHSQNQASTGSCAAKTGPSQDTIWTLFAKSLLETHPIFHKTDETIRGHVFCSFLALVLRKSLQDRLDEMGEAFEWADVIRDLDALEEVEVIQQNERFLLRNEIQGTCGKVFQSAGVKLPRTVRQVDATA